MAHAAHISEENRLRNCEIEWLLDSGCTDHKINNDEYLEKSIDLKENVNIYLGDNRFCNGLNRELIYLNGTLDSYTHRDKKQQ